MKPWQGYAHASVVAISAWLCRETIFEALQWWNGRPPSDGLLLGSYILLSGIACIPIVALHFPHVQVSTLKTFSRVDVCRATVPIILIIISFLYAFSTSTQSFLHSFRVCFQHLNHMQWVPCIISVTLFYAICLLLYVVINVSFCFIILQLTQCTEIHLNMVSLGPQFGIGLHTYFYFR